jgi:protein tyrosine/serine phosphatase
MRIRPLLPVWRPLLSAVFVAILALAAYLGVEQLRGNFHVVVAGEVYRSAQPTEEQIAFYHTAYGIRTIVNLRGANPGAAWYDKEIEQSRRLGITHVDFRMSAARKLSQAQAEQLIATLKQAEKPLLIHCEAGADRSGLAAALYVAALTRSGERAAEAQFSLRYGHFSIPLSRAYAMDQTFENLEPWLGFPDS